MFSYASFCIGRCTVTGAAPFLFITVIIMTTTNPRYKNGNLRRKHRARFKAMQAPCGICRGKLGPIHYDEPSDAKHPFSFVIDEIKPVSKWRFYGYDSPAAAAQDWSNLQAAHYICNAKKGAKTMRKRIISDGSW